jgi:hypothetical protein
VRTLIQASQPALDGRCCGGCDAIYAFSINHFHSCSVYIMADAVKSPAMEVDIKPAVDAEQEQKPAAIEEERRDESQPPPAK